MSRLIIGFVAPSGAGKSEAGRRLLEHGFIRVHAGQLVKDALRYGAGLLIEHVDGHLINQPCHELGGVTPRLVLEHVGDTIHRVAPQATSIHLTAEVNGWAASYDRVFIDGIRHESEAAAVKALGGIVVRIERPGEVDQSLPCNVTQALVVADRVILNDGSLADLIASVDALLTAQA